jgi:octaprenyl-diphosphate synthase
MFVAESKMGRAVCAPGSSADVTPAWKEIVGPLTPFMEEVARGLGEQVKAFDPEIAPYACYALTNQGKQLRPALVALSGGAAGGLNESLVDLAVIIEMVHLATLVHDDVMDVAVLRRSRPTLAANWGNEISVLVGDCLFAHAVMLAASFPTAEVCRAVAVATNKVCSGEILQTHQRGNFSFTRGEYLKALEMKTAELFALSCEWGGRLGGGNDELCGALREFGLAFGTAYQLYDDCLDVFGVESVAGKSLGTDLASGKLTLPVLIAMEKASAADEMAMRDAIGSWNGQSLARVLELLEKYDTRKLSWEVVQFYLERARGALCLLPESSSRRALSGMTYFLAQQTGVLGVSS